MTMNNGHSQLVAQWITSLAISVICCAVLFVVFAGYIVDLHSKINLATVRLEVFQEKHAQLLSEVVYLRRLVTSPSSPREAAPPPEAAAAPAAPPPSPQGVELSEPGAAMEPSEQGEMTPVIPIETPKMEAPKAAEPGKKAAPVQTPQPSKK